MSSIRSIIPEVCPNCGSKRGALYVDQGAIKCRICGYSERKDALNPQPRPAPKRKLQASYYVSHRGEVDAWARAAFETAQDCIKREELEAAVGHLKRALDYQRDFTDAHLWMARIVEDKAVRREHLTTLLAYEPNHMEAIRELMVLDGRLTPEQAERTYHYDDPERREVDLPVAAQTTVLRCPQCGGDLTADDAKGIVTCQFCGYTARRPASNPAGEDSLVMALLERKAQPVQWVIGQRLLHCNNCGADRTIAGTKLSMRCPFCGSNHVIEQDALGSFQQPDGLLPFVLSREQAGEAIKEKLGGWTERVKGWFDNNKVERTLLEGVYLPFWVFDSIIDVVQTTHDQRTSRQGRDTPKIQPYTRVTYAEMVNNLPICAVTSPPPDITAKLGRFNLDRLKPYEPELLAKYPAELYSIDFDKASLEARGVIGRLMREKYGQRSGDEIQVNVFSSVTQMSFQLVLMPVWVGTLLEEDGDVRVAVVNGQTGVAVLGKAEKRA